METSYTASSASPAVQLPTNRSLLKFVLLSIITLGIYGLVVMTKISTEINTIAGPYDNKKTMNYCLVVLIFSWLTMGIVPLVWAHRFSNRVGSELLRRNLPLSVRRRNLLAVERVGLADCCRSLCLHAQAAHRYEHALHRL